MLVEIVQSVVSRSCRSEMKTEFCLGRRYMRSIVMGKGDLHLNARHSKEDNVGKGRADNSKFCLCIIAKPPPVAQQRGMQRMQCIVAPHIRGAILPKSFCENLL